MRCEYEWMLLHLSGRGSEMGWDKTATTVSYGIWDYGTREITYTQWRQEVQHSKSCKLYRRVVTIVLYNTSDGYDAVSSMRWR